MGARMDLTTDELQELATFFARRLTTTLDKVDPSDPPPAGDPVLGWVDLLQRAQADGRLAQLARQAAAADRSDAQLQSAAQLLQVGAGRRVSGGAMALGVVVLVAAVTGVGVAASRQAPEAARTVVAPPVEVGDAAPVSARDAHQDLGFVEAPEPRREAVDTVADALPGRCARSDGGIVGYWYVGERSPGAIGATVEVPRATYVRADYPREDNGFRVDAPIRCVLEAGDIVRLSLAPVHVPLNSWWVPLVSGDLDTAHPPEQVARGF